MLRHQGVLFDKSAFEALPPDAHRSWLFMFVETLTPCLLREIIADLAKAVPENNTPEKLVRGLAKKFHGGGGHVNLDWQFLCIGSLEGQSVQMRGYPVMLEPPIRMVTGSPATFWSQRLQNDAVIRWAHGAFSKGERDYAEQLRATVKSFDPEVFYGRVSHAPASKNLNTLSADVDAFIAQNPALVIDWVIDQLRGYAHANDGSISRHRRLVETDEALQVVAHAELSCIRYRGLDPEVLARFAELGEPGQTRLSNADAHATRPLPLRPGTRLARTQVHVATAQNVAGRVIDLDFAVSAPEPGIGDDTPNHTPIAHHGSGARKRHGAGYPHVNTRNVDGFILCQSGSWVCGHQPSKNPLQQLSERAQWISA